MELEHNCRVSKIDPLYHSTKEWKTLTQWRALGYRPRVNLMFELGFQGAKETRYSESGQVHYLFEHFSHLEPSRILIGYQSGVCHNTVVRIHISLMRKVERW